jgi:hypothetical protein
VTAASSGLGDPRMMLDLPGALKGNLNAFKYGRYTAAAIL